MRNAKESGTHMGIRSPQNDSLVNKSGSMPKLTPAGTNTIADSAPKSANIQSPTDGKANVKRGRG